MTITDLRGSVPKKSTLYKNMIEKSKAYIRQYLSHIKRVFLWKNYNQGFTEIILLP